jgi:hypothetical protein
MGHSEGSRPELRETSNRRPTSSKYLFPWCSCSSTTRLFDAGPSQQLLGPPEQTTGTNTQAWCGVALAPEPGDR